MFETHRGLVGVTSLSGWVFRWPLVLSWLQIRQIILWNTATSWNGKYTCYQWKTSPFQCAMFNRYVGHYQKVVGKEQNNEYFSINNGTSQQYKWMDTNISVVPQDLQYWFIPNSRKITLWWTFTKLWEIIIFNGYTNELNGLFKLANCFSITGG